MKKVYEKPQVHIETFKLAEHIAGCNLTLSSGTVAECNATGTIGSVTFNPGSGSSWFITEGICSVEVEDYCYSNYNSNLATINS